MTELPRLLPDGTVIYATDDDLVASAQQYLTKGALALVPLTPLAPLSVVDVTLSAPRLKGEAVRAKCEVVVIQAERTLLRIIEPAPSSFAALAEPPGPSAEELAAKAREEQAREERALEERAREEQARAEAERARQEHEAREASEAEERRTEEERARRDREATAAEQAATALPPSTSAALLPPYLSGEVLSFASEADFNAAGHDLFAIGAVMATCSATPMPGERRAIKLQVESRLARTAVPAFLQLLAGGTVVVQFENREQLTAVLSEVLPQKQAPEPAREAAVDVDAATSAAAPETKSTGVALSLPLKGPLQNPETVDEVLRLSFARPLEAADLASPSTHLLLRWLMTLRDNVRVDVEFQGHPAHSFVVLQGREVRAPVAMPALARSLVERHGQYVVQVVKRPPRMTQNGTMLGLMQEVTSGYVGRLEVEELERGLEHHGHKSPRLNDVGKRILEGLGFSSSHKRLALKALTGKESVYGVTQHAAGARIAYEVLYTLEITGALDWVDAEGVLQEERHKKDKERLERLVEGAAGFWEKIKGANHFEVMGLHWSTPPRKIKPAYDELERLYGPNGEARAKAPDVCARIWDRVVKAYGVLSDAPRRKAYRKEAYALQWSAQISLMLDRADIAIYRKDFEEAADLLAVCQDIQTTREAAERVVKLQEAKAKAGLRDMTIDDIDFG